MTKDHPACLYSVIEAWLQYSLPMLAMALVCLQHIFRCLWFHVVNSYLQGGLLPVDVPAEILLGLHSQ